MKKPVYAKATLEHFLGDLSSAEGAPGGGAAAALAGALGTSLLEMTVRINARRDKAKGNKQFAHKVKWLGNARKTLLGLMTKDAQAFQRISDLFRAKEKGAPWQAALKNGAAVPYQMAQIISAASDILPEEAPRTSVWLISDLKESGLLLSAAFDSASLNVEINLKDMKDKRIVRGMRQSLGQIKAALNSNLRSLSRKTS